MAIGPNKFSLTWERLIVLARQAAAAHGLDPATVCAVVEQESGWNPWAIRYEPLFYDRYIKPQVIARELKDITEARARAFSWGLMQVMGQTARNEGYAGSLAALCDPPTGLDVGVPYLAKKLAEAGGDWTKALLKWNGGGNPKYPFEVLQRRKNYAAG